MFNTFNLLSGINSIADFLFSKTAIIVYIAVVVIIVIAIGSLTNGVMIAMTRLLSITPVIVWVW